MAGFSQSGFDHSFGQGSKKEITVVEVRNPVMYDEGALKKSFTDYEVCIKTTSKAFIIPQSSVRRRYSDFVWLKKWLEKQNDAFSRVKMPKLPPKKLVGRNDPDFVQKRMKGLQKFLRKIIEHNVFLSDKALHLFLQSGMKVNQIENYLNSGRGFVDNSDALISHFEKESKQTTQSALHSISESISIDAKNEINDGSSEGDSSSFSSLSSIRDSFEAVNIQDCQPYEEDGDNLLKKEEEEISSPVSQQGVTCYSSDDKDSLEGSERMTHNDQLMDEKNKLQNFSNSSSAECVQDCQPPQRPEEDHDDLLKRVEGEISKPVSQQGVTYYSSEKRDSLEGLEQMMKNDQLIDEKNKDQHLSNSSLAECDQ